MGEEHYGTQPLRIISDLRHPRRLSNRKIVLLFTGWLRLR